MAANFLKLRKKNKHNNNSHKIIFMDNKGRKIQSTYILSGIALKDFCFAKRDASKHNCVLITAIYRHFPRCALDIIEVNN